MREWQNLIESGTAETGSFYSRPVCCAVDTFPGYCQRVTGGGLCIGDICSATAQLGDIGTAVSIYSVGSVALCRHFMCFPAAAWRFAVVSVCSGKLADYHHRYYLNQLVSAPFFPYYWPTENSLWWLWRNIAVALVLGGIALRYFYLQHQLRMREQLALQSKLQALQARIRPHFLFNTMNSIASLIGAQPKKAEKVLEDLCELLRASLSEYRSMVTLAEELRLCRLYLHIEQLRLDSRLQINWQVEGEIESEQIPSLILQPLPENAVHHGVAQLRQGG